MKSQSVKKSNLKGLGLKLGFFFSLLEIVKLKIIDKKGNKIIPDI
jgi:hypothetical protein